MRIFGRSAGLMKLVRVADRVHLGLSVCLLCPGQHWVYQLWTLAAKTCLRMSQLVVEVVNESEVVRGGGL